MRVFSNPVCQRSIGLIRKHIQAGAVVYYLGSGVDIQLTKDAGINNSPSWENLVTDLYKKPFENNSRKNMTQDEKTTLANLSKKFPNEIASSARWSLGDDKFNEEVKNKFSKTIEIDFSKASTTHSLCKLLSKASLIITTNYSNYIYKALVQYIELCSLSKRIVVISREDMASFNFSDSNKNNNVIKFIYIHGRCSNGSYPILDAWGYNIAQNDDKFYIDFLNNLFLSNHVITIGTSWEDIPLRNSAALVMRTRPYANQCHIAFFRNKKLCNSKSVYRSWSNAMKGAYGVSFVNVIKDTNDNSAQLMDYLNSDFDYPDLDDYCGLAKFLDETGDYESSLQNNFLYEKSKIDGDGDKHKKISSTVECIYDNLLNNFNKIKWETIAAIERHMRHHIYLYTSYENLDKGKKRRKELWNKLRKTIPIVSKFKKLDGRLRFDFIVGGWEIEGADCNTIYSSYYNNLPEIFKERLEVVKKYNIWMGVKERLKKNKNTQKIETEFENIALKLLDAGWESMAAKVLCDKTAFLVHCYKKVENNFLSFYDYSNKIVNQAIRAEAIARSVGCFRRRIKADVINAIWHPDSQMGRTLLLGRLRANETIQSLEPGLLDALGIGLLVCYVKNKRNSISPPSIEKDEALELFSESGLGEDNLKRALGDYWKPLLPNSVNLCFDKLNSQICS